MPNSNIRNGSIKKCKMNASKTPYKARPPKLTKSQGGIEYDPIIYFEHNEQLYRKATEQYRADNGSGWCQVCVRGYKKYRKKHHHTCSKASDYCDVRQQVMVDINKRLRYEGTAGLCDPKTGAVLNLTELPNGELKQIFVADGGEGEFVGTPELKRIQQQSCFSTLKSPIRSALAMKQLDTIEEEDKLFEELRREGENDETKALQMEKEKEERHRQLQQHQQQWKNFSWGKQNDVVSVSTGASQNRKSPLSYAITNTNNHRKK